MSKDVGELEPKWSVSVKGRLTSQKKDEFSDMLQMGAGGHLQSKN